MNGNSSKQVLLSVLGIAILVVAVVGVSFAFFSYTKNGSVDNTIQTGQIYTYFTENNNISLTNAMPRINNLTSASDQIADPDTGVLKFTVTGYNNSATPIAYKVYLANGDEANTFPDGSVKFIMNATGGGVISDNAKGSTGTTTNGSLTDMSTVIGVGGSLSNGVQIASGTFAAKGDNPAAEVPHTYVINMYVDPDIKISDTDTKVNNVETKYCALERTTGKGCELYHDYDDSGKVKNVNTEGLTTEQINSISAYSASASTGKVWLPVFGNKLYSVKVRVVANTYATNTTYDYDGSQGRS